LRRLSGRRHDTQRPDLAPLSALGGTPLPFTQGPFVPFSYAPYGLALAIKYLPYSDTLMIKVYLTHVKSSHRALQIVKRSTEDLRGSSDPRNF
jgi:hypothetical protein